MGDLSSGELLLSSRAGDRAALHELLDRHLGDLRAFVRLKMPALLRRREESTDLVQSICLEILQRDEPVELRDERSFKNWLFGAVEFQVSNRMRRLRTAKRDPAREQRFDDAASRRLLASYASLVTPSEEAIAREELIRIEDACERLTTDQQEVLRCSRILGMPHQEIADRLGKSSEAVRAILHRALVRLSIELEKRG